MSKKIYDGYIPYDGNGNPLSYTQRKYPEPPDRCGEWKINDIFNAELKITKIERGRSAAHFILYDTKTNQKYTMFLADAIDLIQNHTIVKGTISGDWAFTKRGQNFGVIFCGGL